MRTRRGQRGWTTLVVLAALAIAAYLARDALLQLVPAPPGGTAARESRLPPAAAVAPESAAVASVPAPAAVERARVVEDVVRERAEQVGRRIDAPR